MVVIIVMVVVMDVRKIGRILLINPIAEELNLGSSQRRSARWHPTRDNFFNNIAASGVPWDKNILYLCASYESLVCPEIEVVGIVGIMTTRIRTPRRENRQKVLLKGNCTVSRFRSLCLRRFINHDFLFPKGFINHGFVVINPVNKVLNFCIG